MYRLTDKIVAALVYFIVPLLIGAAISMTFTLACGSRTTGTGVATETLQNTSTNDAGAPLTLVSSAYAENRTAMDPMTISNISAQANQLIVVFIASDGPPEGPQKISGLSGGGLSWSLAVRANGLPGDAEIWYSMPTVPVSNISISAPRAAAGCNTGICNGLLGVMVFDGIDGSRPVGITGISSQATGMPSVSLTTTRDRSWVFGVGCDWSHAVPRTIAAGQTMGHDDISTENDDDYWIQYMSAPTPASGTPVTLSDAAPTDRMINFAAIEIYPK